MKKLLPLILAVLGTLGGLGAGYMLHSPDTSMQDDAMAYDTAPPKDKKIESKSKETTKKQPSKDSSDKGGKDYEYVKLNNQFVVPVVKHEVIDSLVVVSLSLEVAYGETQTIYDLEPKLRDAFLQVLFNHTNFGGFSGEFTNYNTMEELRKSLDESAYSIAGDTINAVLITELVRQDV